MVKNVIFDLGGVILDLDVPKTLTGFSRLSGLSPEEVTRLFKTSQEFLAFEKGEIDEKEFRDFVRKLYSINATDEQLDDCWNAMLLTIPREKLALLAALRKKYRTYLLSNTNTIHLDFINQRVIPSLTGVRSLDDFFDKTYYSHLMKKRKPEPEIFQQVLKENGLDAADTLFLDDNTDNIQGAKAVGLQTAYVNTANFILDYFHEQRTA